MRRALPEYREDLPDFVGILRAYLGWSQRKMGRYVKLHHTTITRYERDGIKTNIGYLVCLIRLVWEESPRTTAHQPKLTQAFLLKQLNRAIKHHYVKEPTFKSWTEVCSVADEYLQEHLKKSTPINNLAHQAEKDSRTITGILKQLETTVDNRQMLEQTLRMIEQQRQDSLLWMSRTQRQLLEVVPDDPILIDDLLQRIRVKISPLSQIRDNELYLRLHELRYLGWIARQQRTEQWYYWRDGSADSLSPDSYQIIGQRMGTNEVQTIKSILQQVHSNLGDQEELKKKLMDIEADRRNAIQRLSKTQQAVLASLPPTPTLVDFVLIAIRDDVSSLSKIRDKELYLRLHELRYLGLINRNLVDERWYYWRENEERMT